ncbi:MAG: DUF4168 domain-containing protein [Coleofasciculus sp. G1-WW12-02]|uniref:DUF4168 domain-containing protein n=1 Tax=unclassified Coleofasciculus TaxID=2692782 RepID=UPI0032F3275B
MSDSMPIQARSQTYRIPWTSCIAALAFILSGCASNSNPEASPSISPLPAETITEEDIKNYAKALLAIEGSRQTAFSEIQQQMNQEQIPSITCTQPDSLKELPSDVQGIAVNYCNTAKELGESQGFSMAQFNAMTYTAQLDPDLQRQIQNELIRLQR